MSEVKRWDSSLVSPLCMSRPVKLGVAGSSVGQSAVG